MYSPIKFRTEAESHQPPFKISLNERGLLMGSCFTAEIGKRMRDLYWDVSVNPCGTIFNPDSILRLLRIAQGKEELRYREHNGAWHCMEMSSAFSSVSYERCEAMSRESIEKLRQRCEEADFAILTFGTAWVYRMDGATVGNCHKIPQNRFLRERLSVEETIRILEETIRRLRYANPEIKIILTVSPVRHIGDTLHGNNLSKSTLLLAVDEVCRRCPGVDYFASYEILLDDLRDYRFYASDLCHPSEQAVDYIWNRFCSCYLSEEERNILGKISSLKKRMEHRPLVADIPYEEEREKARKALDEILSQIRH